MRILAPLIALLSLSAFGATIEGRVVGVIDGDTIDVLDESKSTHRIRFHGIDAPERAQPFSRKSKDTLSELVFGKAVTVDHTKDDRYGRKIGRVFVDGQDVAIPMLEAGMAWQYVRYDQSKAYAAAEQAARDAQRGLWSEKNAIPPWEWRKMPKAERDLLRQ
jgi:endonuclease YncB( thermonuclease family)